ncbi:unnamed protein product [Cuscuta epithymum]|uniref:Complex III subunit VII n=1 Tax=Cuscuta epithymum TaxID=186058 RepID=A0AAV0GD88_9ASTE|nr:unnamed protein product [Cuscuta epithymum]
MAMSFTRWFVDPKKNPLAAIHKKTLSSRLRKYGLRYDDLYDPMYDLDIKEAMNRLPREIVDARNQRLKRAMDLSMKHQYLPEDVRQRRHLLEAIFRKCWPLSKGRVQNAWLLGLYLSISAHFLKAIFILLPFCQWMPIIKKNILWKNNCGTSPFHECGARNLVSFFQ